MRFKCCYEYDYDHYDYYHDHLQDYLSRKVFLEKLCIQQMVVRLKTADICDLSGLSGSLMESTILHTPDVAVRRS